MYKINQEVSKVDTLSASGGSAYTRDHLAVDKYCVENINLNFFEMKMCDKSQYVSFLNYLYSVHFQNKC